jgi:hypothetical protein
MSPALACQGYGPQASSPYVLPYLPGQSYVVIQGNCSTGTHLAGGVNKYAYDFAMPVGTEVHAARAGTVFNIEQRNLDFNSSLAPNFVWVRHDDLSVGRYLNLTRNGARVTIGQRVAAGDLIGLSGAAGVAFGDTPHLHFDEAECGEVFCQTLPINFRNTTANANGLESGKTYVAQ